MPLDFIEVSKDHASFVLEKSGRKFVPWGFNYDHDEAGRLIEDYWDEDWTEIEEDFREMKGLGATVVRIHPQFGKFMDAPDNPNEHSLKQLERLVGLAESLGLYLDVTGLGCYHKKDVPAWYDKLGEQEKVGRPRMFLGGDRHSLCREPGHLLLRPDERAGGCWRGEEAR